MSKPRLRLPVDWLHGLVALGTMLFVIAGGSDAYLRRISGGPLDAVPSVVRWAAFGGLGMIALAAALYRWAPVEWVRADESEIMTTLARGRELFYRRMVSHPLLLAILLVFVWLEDDLIASAYRMLGRKELFTLRQGEEPWTALHVAVLGGGGIFLAGVLLELWVRLRRLQRRP